MAQEEDSVEHYFEVHYLTVRTSDNLFADTAIWDEIWQAHKPIQLRSRHHSLSSIRNLNSGYSSCLVRCKERKDKPRSLPSLVWHPDRGHEPLKNYGPLLECHRPAQVDTDLHNFGSSQRLLLSADSVLFLNLTLYLGRNRVWETYGWGIRERDCLI